MWDRIRIPPVPVGSRSRESAGPVGPARSSSRMGPKTVGGRYRWFVAVWSTREGLTFPCCSSSWALSRRWRSALEVTAKYVSQTGHLSTSRSFELIVVVRVEYEVVRSVRHSSKGPARDDERGCVRRSLFTGLECTECRGRPTHCGENGKNDDRHPREPPHPRVLLPRVSIPPSWTPTATTCDSRGRVSNRRSGQPSAVATVERRFRGATPRPRRREPFAVPSVTPERSATLTDGERSTRGLEEARHERFCGGR